MKYRYLIDPNDPPLTRNSVLAIPVDFRGMLPGRCSASCPKCTGLRSCPFWDGEARLTHGWTQWPRFADLPDKRFRCGLREHVVTTARDQVRSTFACEHEQPSCPFRIHGAPDRFSITMPLRARSSKGNPHLGGAGVGQLVMYVVLPSGPREAAKRRAVRTGWVADALVHHGAERWLYDFFVGVAGLDASEIQALQLESQSYGDLVFLDMVDCYANLTRKAMYMIGYAQRIVRPRFLIRLNTNQRLQARRMLTFLGGLSDEYIAKYYPNGFMWSTRGCVAPHVLEELTCYTVPLEISGPLLVEGSLIPYPQGSWLASEAAYSRMLDRYAHIVSITRGVFILPPGYCEDCFEGLLVSAAGVPILDFSPDGRRLWLGPNCSRGFVLHDETPQQLGRPLPGCL